MSQRTLHSQLKTFVSPRTFGQQSTRVQATIAVAAIIPSFRPGPLTVQLIRDLVRWNPTIDIYVVDDCTPIEDGDSKGFFKQLQRFSSRVTLLRTSTNRLKAGALNYALEYIRAEGTLPEVIITLDDDIVIESRTIKNLVASLLADERLGAVCSQSRALNKSQNLLTRLQGLEYLGFNAARLSDEGFFHGPLVMHGMLTAFRANALLEVDGFRENHLIEDYDVTARIKEKGWEVRLAPNAYAWTEVPSTLGQLWRQRARWISGGIEVVLKSSYRPAVIQDIFGHGLFIATLLVIIALYLLPNEFALPFFPVPIISIVIAFSLLQVALWYVFQLWFMRFYDERDAVDWIIRLVILPEFLYANFLSLVLIAAYLALIVQKGIAKMPKSTVTTHLLLLLSKLGYTQSWGTHR